MLVAMSGDGKGSGPVRRPRVIERPQVPPGPLADLKALIYELYLRAGTPTLDEIAAAVADDDELAGAPSRDTISRIIGDPGLPASQADVVAVVTVLARAARWDPGDAAGRARDRWVAAWMASARYPAGGIRVSQADPRRLGVHAAISVPGVPDEVPPEYVPRDADDGESGVRAKVAAAAERGGFVLLVGGSSVGKTRCAFEAVTALLSDWWLVHPAGPDEFAALVQAPPRRTVVWLDELQRYLDGERGLTGGVVRALLNAPHPAVIIGTLWPDRYNAYTAVPAPGAADPYAREREVLDLAAVIRIAPEFSPAEQDRARAAAARDPRLTVALKAAGYGLTQTLAAAPQLVARWEDAQTADPYAWAVLTAALDVARLGARAPLSADLLRAAAPGYCTSQQQAEAPDNWFEQALAYATDKLHGAVAALSPAGAGMGQVAGYIVADYLIQHASRERRYARVPASTWDAVLSHLRDPADAARLADSARNRLLYRYAIPLYRHCRRRRQRACRPAAGRAAGQARATWTGRCRSCAPRADAGDGEAACGWPSLLAGRGDLRRGRSADRCGADRPTPADGCLAASGWPSCWPGAATWTGCAPGPTLATGSPPCGWPSCWPSAATWTGCAPGPTPATRLPPGGWPSCWPSAATWTGCAPGPTPATRLPPCGWPSCWPSAATWTRPRRYCAPGPTPATACRRAAGRAAGRARRPGRGGADTARPGRRRRRDAARRLAELLAERGDLDGLRARADAGDGYAALRLAELLAERGDLDGLRARADAGDELPPGGWPSCWPERGDLDGLQYCARADAGDWFAAGRLAELLAERGDLDGLRARADAGDGYAAWRLAELLAERGDLDGLAIARADAGDEPSGRPTDWPTC